MHASQAPQNVPPDRDTREPPHRLLDSLSPGFLRDSVPSQKSVQNPYKSDHFRECEFFSCSASIVCNFNAVKCTDFYVHRSLSLGERVRVRDKLVSSHPDEPGRRSKHPEHNAHPRNDLQNRPVQPSGSLRRHILYKMRLYETETDANSPSLRTKLKTVLRPVSFVHARFRLGVIVILISQGYRPDESGRSHSHFFPFSPCRLLGVTLWRSFLQ